MNNIALDGVIVVDLTRFAAGPYATMMLADMGARVIRVETRQNTDGARLYGPLLNGESGYYMALNRNKESITLDMKKEKGKKILWEMIKKADILVENFRPGVAKKLGFGYDDVHKVKPSVVYASISGFGQTGPYKNLPGYDIVVQAMGGLMDSIGYADGPPLRVGTSISDLVAGMSADIGILAAYAKSMETGKGQYIDIALADTVISCMCTWSHIYLMSGENARRSGNGDPMTAVYGGFRCSDGYITIGCAMHSFFEKVAVVIGKPELLEDSRFSSYRAASEHRDILNKIVEDWTIRHTVEDAVRLLREADVPCGPVNNTEQIVNDPQFGIAREMFPEIDHPIAGKVRITGNHIKMSDTPTGVRTLPPALGQHTDSVLKELLGLDDEELRILHREEVI